LKHFIFVVLMALMPITVFAGGIGPQPSGPGIPGGPYPGPGPGPGPGPYPGPGPGPHPGPGPQPGGPEQVCFYQDINYGGQSFCVVGDSANTTLVPSGWNDQISSIYIQGYASVDVYQDINYGGQHLTLSSSVADIRSYGAQWNDMISSYVIRASRPGPGPGPGPYPGPGPGEVCFYEGANFSGQSFCMVPGQYNPNLVPSGWNDRISSVYVQGDAGVVVYQDINYGGTNIFINRSTADLRQDGPQWDDFISSMNVTHSNGR